MAGPPGSGTRTVLVTGAVGFVAVNVAIYNLGVGTNVTVREVMAAIRRVWPAASVEVGGGGPANPNLDPGRIRGPLAVERLRDELGFRPRFDIDRGIERYAEWIRQRGDR